MASAPAFAIVAHELRSPAAVIVGYARMLREGRLDDKGQQQAFIQIQRAADRISSIGQQAAALARWLVPDAGGAGDVRPLGTLVADAMTRAKSPERVSVEFAVGAELLRVRCLDRDAWAGALASVVDSVDAEAAGALLRIVVRIASPVSCCDILVGRAEGIGAETEAVVTDSDGALSRERGGHGLALVLAEAVFRAHAGIVGTFGERRDRVVITLPAEQQA